MVAHRACPMSRIVSYHGLAFGVLLHKFGATKVYLEGQRMCRGDLARDAGPRPVLNALERLAEEYDYDIRHLKAEINVK
jgi:hypothetical protein